MAGCLSRRPVMRMRIELMPIVPVQVRMRVGRDARIVDVLVNSY
jgi:hypothetical protein